MGRSKSQNMEALAENTNKSSKVESLLIERRRIDSDRNQAEAQKLQAKIKESLVNFGVNSFSHPLLFRRVFERDSRGNYKPSARAKFIFYSIQYVTNKPFEKLIDNPRLIGLLLTGEIMITSMYLFNHYQDQKYGVKCLDSRKNNKSESNKTFHLLKKVLNHYFPSSSLHKVREKFQELNEFYKKGMGLDKHILNFKNYSLDVKDPERESIPEKYLEVLRDFSLNILNAKGDDIGNHSFFSLYLTRNFLMNSYFYLVFIDLIEILFEEEILGENSVNEVRNYAGIYGISQQLVNDISDFIPEDRIVLSIKNHEHNSQKPVLNSICKLPEDAQSDIRLGLVTFPLQLYLESVPSSDDFISMLLKTASANDEKLVLTPEEQNLIVKEILVSGSIRKGITFSRYVGRKGKSVLNKKNPYQKKLGSLLKLSSCNKYFSEYYILHHDVTK